MRTPGGRDRGLVVNPVVRTLLRSPAHRLLSGSLLLLDDTGRRSGRRYVLPVAYAGDDLVVVVGQPATKSWCSPTRPGSRVPAFPVRPGVAGAPRHRREDGAGATHSR